MTICVKTRKKVLINICPETVRFPSDVHFVFSRQIILPIEIFNISRQNCVHTWFTGIPRLKTITYRPTFSKWQPFTLFVKLTVLEIINIKNIKQSLCRHFMQSSFDSLYTGTTVV